MANVAWAWISTAYLPERVAIHFGVGGEADGWGSAQMNALFTTGLYLVLFLVLDGTPWLVARLPARWINLPHREYWLQPAMRTHAAAKISMHIRLLGTVLFLFLFIVSWLAFDANRAQPVRLNMKLFLSTLGAFLVFTAGWTAHMLSAFRLPTNGTN
jgi:uncharacterized membrane protein